MIAFVLGGGNNYGSMQAGALLALAEAGIRPDIVVGTSAGAINGVMVAYDPSPEHMQHLTDIWRNLSADDVFPGSYASALWRLARGETGLFSNEAFRRFLRSNLPAGVSTFADLPAARMYTVATEIPTGGLHIFGEDPTDNLLNAMLASAAIPPLHPTFEIAGRQFIDGAFSAKLPLRVAIEKGAKQIYALHVYQNPVCSNYQDTISVTQWAISKLLNDQDQLELQMARQKLGKNLRYIQLESDLNLSSFDFSNADALIEQGHLLTKACLNGLTPSYADQLNQNWEAFKSQCATISRRLNSLKAQLFRAGHINSPPH